MKRISQIAPEVIELSEKCIKNNNIDPALYKKYDVKRGLRDINGNRCFNLVLQKYPKYVQVRLLTEKKFQCRW